MGGEGFEPSKACHQIYSLTPLATRETLRLQITNYENQMANEPFSLDIRHLAFATVRFSPSKVRSR